MKRLYLILIFVCFCACRQERKHVNTVALQDYKKAYAFFGHNDDSSFFYLNRIVSIHKDSLQTATAYNYMAAIQSGAGDYFGAQESLALSLKFLDTLKTSHRACLTSDYNELGLTDLDLKEPAASVPYFEKAVQLTDNPNYRRVYLNNKALAYQQSGAYTKALSIYHELIREQTDSGTYARILTNQAMSEWGFDKHYPAAQALLKALHIRRLLKDNWGLNSSFANLATYYQDTKPDSSLFYAHQQYTVATRLNSPDDRVHALEQLIELSPAPQAKQYFKVYHELDDSVQKARNAAKNQFALIRFNVQRKEADNLKLQKENADANFKVNIQRLVLIFVVILFAAATALIRIWFRKRKQQMVLDARRKELRLSQKVHDVVANGLYQVMSSIENKPELEKEVLLDQIELLYEQSRDISYEPVLQNQHPLAARIKDLIDAFSGETIRIGLSGNDLKVWQGTDPAVEAPFLAALQELLVNMRKHSQASFASVNFRRSGKMITMEMRDDGIGLPDHITQGNGLSSTVSRIKGMGGTITFGKNLPAGALIMISFPAA